MVGPTLLLLLLLSPLRVEGARPVETVGTVRHAPLTEISGIVQSGRQPGVYWVHNDSGNEPRFFAIDGRGRILTPGGILVREASNVDWEDVALGDQQLYLADVGNNENDRRDLGVYVVREPNPFVHREAVWSRFLPVRYPDQRAFPPEGSWDYDCEAVFYADGKLYLLTRHRSRGQGVGFTGGTRLYRLDSDHTDRDNVLTLVDSREGVGAVGGADLSPDGNRLAVLTYRALWVFERPPEGDAWLSGRAHRLTLPMVRTRQAEAVCWDDDETLRIVNEGRRIFRVKLDALSPIDGEVR